MRKRKFKTKREKRYKNIWEELLAETLKQEKVKFYYERITLFANGYQYKPDFILKDIRIDGKTIILEPHNPIYGFKNIKEVMKHHCRKYYIIVLISNANFNRFNCKEFLEFLEEKKIGTLWPFEYRKELISNYIKKGKMPFITPYSKVNRR